MTRIISTAFAAVIVVGLTAQIGYGQCAFEHPEKAKKFQVALTQSMFPCGVASGGGPPNATTEDGIDACGPPETFNEVAGTPDDGWQWNSKSKGTLLLKTAKKDQSGLGLDGDTDTDGGADNPADIGDVQVRLKLSNIVDQTGLLANGSGILTILVRATYRDRLNGELTPIDIPLLLTFDLVNGKTTLKSSANFPLDTLSGVAPLPRCASLEIIGIQVLDANGNSFAAPGLFLARL